MGVKSLVRFEESVQADVLRVGAVAEKLGDIVAKFGDDSDMNDARSFEFRSLYKLSIGDMRMSPFWLLPVGKKILLVSGEVL